MATLPRLSDTTVMATFAAATSAHKYHLLYKKMHNRLLKSVMHNKLYFNLYWIKVSTQKTCI